MGSYQVKCSCGEFSTTKIIITSSLRWLEPDPRGYFFGHKTLSQISGYEGWSMAPPGDDASPCDNCAATIIENLNKNQVEYSIKKFPKGLWRTDLP